MWASRTIRSLVLPGLLVSSLAFASVTGHRRVLPNGEAFRDGMVPGRWSSANKQFFGTSYEAYDSANQYSGNSPTAPISRVWFTGAHGTLTEIMWPTVDTPQVCDSQFLVSDGNTLFFEERRDAVTSVEWLGRGIPAYRVTNSDPRGRFVIEKTIFTDPDRDVVIQRVRITRKSSGLRFYYLHNPSVSSTPMGNSARVSMGGTLGEGLFAWQDNQAQSVIFSVPLKQASAGFEGASDGYQDLRDNLQMDYSFETATQGNVALMAALDLPQGPGVSEFDIAIGFAPGIEAAGQLARASLQDGPDRLQAKYITQWEGYQQSVYDLSNASSDGGALFRASVAVLKSQEDKTSEGAFVASPTIPWGEHQVDTNSVPRLNGSRAHLIGGYHEVWPRDLYQIATTFLAVKDTRSAIASLNFLTRAQYKSTDGEWTFGGRRRSKDGSFPQNMWVNGEVYWPGLQMDETAFPVILAYRLWKQNAIRPEAYWDMVRRAADFIRDYGPWSPQERWEEAPGISPSTVAAEITALWTAASFADQLGDTARAAQYRATATDWSVKPADNIDAWTFTSTGGLGSGHYFVRVCGAEAPYGPWDPNGEQTFGIANGAGRWREKDVVDGGFLELVRLGVRSALDNHIVQTLPEYDASVGVDIPGVGQSFRRYTHDRYNYDDLSGQQTDGMLWPFLTGERGHYELERALEEGRSAKEAAGIMDPYITAMEKLATASMMLPEQVWDYGPNAGEPTGSATPLGWTHGEYIKLLRSRTDNAIFDRIYGH